MVLLARPGEVVTREEGVISGGQPILFIRVDRNESDLMMIEDFR